MAKTKSDKSTVDFEAALAELNKIVEQMEHGDLSLEDSLQKFERGVLLARTCQSLLKAAEQKVQILVEQNGKANLTTFIDEVDSER